MTDYDRGFEDGAEAVQRQVDEQRLSRYEPAYVEELEAQLAELREAVREALDESSPWKGYYRFRRLRQLVEEKDNGMSDA